MEKNREMEKEKEKDPECGEDANKNTKNLVVGDKKITVNKSELIKFSSYFKAMFEHFKEKDMKSIVINLNNYDADTVAECIKFIENGECDRTTLVDRCCDFRHLLIYFAALDTRLSLFNAIIMDVYKNKCEFGISAIVSMFFLEKEKLLQIKMKNYFKEIAINDNTEILGAELIRVYNDELINDSDFYKLYKWWDLSIDDCPNLKNKQLINLSNLGDFPIEYSPDTFGSFSWLLEFMKNRENVCISGGFVLGILNKNLRKESDIDLYICGDNQKICKTIGELMLLINEKCGPNVLCSIKYQAITVCTDKADRNLQIIINHYKQVGQIVRNFDFDCCRCIFWMGQFYGTVSFVKCFRTRIINNKQDTTGERFLKYYESGFTFKNKVILTKDGRIISHPKTKKDLKSEDSLLEIDMSHIGSGSEIILEMKDKIGQTRAAFRGKNKYYFPKTEEFKDSYRLKFIISSVFGSNVVLGVSDTTKYIVDLIQKCDAVPKFTYDEDPGDEPEMMGIYFTKLPTYISQIKAGTLSKSWGDINILPLKTPIKYYIPLVYANFVCKMNAKCSFNIYFPDMVDINENLSEILKQRISEILETQKDLAKKLNYNKSSEIGPVIKQYQLSAQKVESGNYYKMTVYCDNLWFYKKSKGEEIVNYGLTHRVLSMKQIPKRKLTNVIRGEEDYWKCTTPQDIMKLYYKANSMVPIIIKEDPVAEESATEEFVKKDKDPYDFVEITDDELDV